MRLIVSCALLLAAGCAQRVPIGYPTRHPVAEVAPVEVEVEIEVEDDDDEWVDTTRVGVLLPLSGRYQQYGERALAAIRIATRDTHVELVVRDTAGDPKRATRAVADLKAKKHVVAIIGPLFSKTAVAAALEAQRLRVPIVLLSHRPGLAELGPWVFRSALTAEAQAKALAEVAFEELGIDRFALLFPRNNYGQDFALTFWDEVDRRHGEIRGVESYEVGQTTFRDEVRKLVGLYQYRGSLYSEELVVDFDAIVVPATPLRLGMIAPALAVEDVVLTRDRRQITRIRRAMGVESVKPVRLLGGSTWNSDQTLEHCGRDCEWAVFVDAFYPDSPEVRVRDFVAAFRDDRGSEPQLLDAIAFDTAALVVELLCAGAKDRGWLRAALLDVSAYDGLTGTLGFLSNGEVERTLRVLTIRNQTIRSWRRGGA